jgi:hypothetical protein
MSLASLPRRRPRRRTGCAEYRPGRLQLERQQHADELKLRRQQRPGSPLWDRQAAPQQFGQWAGDLLHGNMGVSEQSGRSVTSLIGAALPVTLELAVAAMLIGPGARGRIWRSCRGARLVALAGLGVPSFVIGAGLVAFLASVFHYFPSSEGFASLGADPWLNIQQIFWPALTLGLGIGAAILRTTRGGVAAGYFGGAVPWAVTSLADLILAVQVTLALGWAVLIEASLDFLGLGPPPPAATLGLMVSEGTNIAGIAWWNLAFPAVAVVLLVLGFTLTGDGLRDALDPGS